jgi:hypothetical protein
MLVTRQSNKQADSTKLAFYLKMPTSMEYFYATLFKDGHKETV